MKPKVRKILLWSFFPIFYLVCFVFFAYLTFPFDTLRDQVIVRFSQNQRKTGGNKQLEIDKLDSYWLTGIQAKGVRIITPPHVTLAGKQKPRSELSIDELSARVAILPLLIGRLKINFGVEAFGGTLDGWTRNSSDGRLIEVEMEDLALSKIDPIAQTLGLPMGGKLGGKANLTLPEGKISKATGSTELTIADLSLGDGKAKIQNTITLPTVDAGDLVVTCDIADGKVSITKFEAQGNDVDFSAEGKITLRDRFADSQGDVYFKFRFSDKYRGKDDKTKALFGAPGSNAPALFELTSTKIRSAKRPDGFYSFRAIGLLRSLSFSAAPTGGSSSPSRGTGAGIRGFSR